MAGTHPPSERKLRLLREQGLAPQSRLLASALVILGAAIWLWYGAPAAVAELSGYLRAVLRDPTAIEPTDALGLAATTLTTVLVVPLLAALLLGTLGSGLQLGGLFAPRALLPDLSRLDPIRGLSRMFSPASLVTILIITIVMAGAAIDPLREALRSLLGRTSLAPSLLASVGLESIARLLWRAGLTLAVIGVADAAWQRYRFRREHRMDHAELRREQRETEGEPEAKRRRAHAAREHALGLPIDQVAESVVLSVHAPEVIVAITWPDRDNAPEIAMVARGAAKLLLDRKLRSARVPMVQDAALAIALSRATKVVPRTLGPRLARHVARSAR